MTNSVSIIKFKKNFGERRKTNMINVLKKIGIGFFFILCLGQSFCVNAQEPVFEKDGEAYLIQSAEDMRTLALLVNEGKEVEPGVAAHNASYRLTRDIDLSPYCTGEEGWEPIGRGCGEEENETCVREFNGTFDGGNHVVTGLSINRPNADDQGLFGNRTDMKFGKSADMWQDSESAEYQKTAITTIKNLYIKDCDIIGFQYVGGVIGGSSRSFSSADSGDINIENCHVTGRIMGESAVGGIAGWVSNVKNSDFSGTVKGVWSAGDIADNVYYVYGCAVHADVEGYHVGGIACTAFCVQNSYVTGSVKGQEEVGGIAGVSATLTGCYTIAEVSGYVLTGGMAGKIKRLTRPKDSGKPTITKCLMGGHWMESPEWKNPEYHYDGNGYVYGSWRRWRSGFDEEDADPDFYYRKGLKLDGFIEGQNFSTKNCKSYDCTHLEETDFQELLGRPEEEWSDVWYCAADYAWPILAWEKDSRFGYTVTVTVQEGDSLWEIADAVYGDGHFWTQIYEENQERIGGDANLILPGTDLEIAVNASQADYAAKGDTYQQAGDFLMAEWKQGMPGAEVESYYRRMLTDDLWNSATWRKLGDWVIADLDGNGRKDMMVTVVEGGADCPGEAWLYLNEEPVCVLKGEDVHYGEDYRFSSFSVSPLIADLDNDGNLELLFAAMSNGWNSDISLYRHVGEGWEECRKELPLNSDSGMDEAGIRVIVSRADHDTADIDTNVYEAYCPLLEERKEFTAERWSQYYGNTDTGEQKFGSNAWVYGFACVDYRGKNALQFKEKLKWNDIYVYGGVIGDAVFILTWDENGICRVSDWWVERERWRSR